MSPLNHQMLESYRAVARQPIIFKLWWYVMHFTTAQKVFIFSVWILAMIGGTIWGVVEFSNFNPPPIVSY